jgi:hypothetical protein
MAISPRAISVVLASVMISFTATASAELIDRVMAIVAGRVITLSEVTAARELGLVDPPAGSDPVADALDHLIARELVLTEVDRYAPPAPTALQIDGRLAMIRARFSTPESFAAALTQWGYAEPELREIVRDDLRIQTYLDQRFAAAAQPTDEEVVTYYREHEAEFVMGGELPPLARIQETVRQRLATERRRTLIADWIAGLRRRSEVTVLYLPRT